MEKYKTFEHSSAGFALSASDFELPDFELPDFKLSASETCPSVKFQSEMMTVNFPDVNIHLPTATIQNVWAARR